MAMPSTRFLIVTLLGVATAGLAATFAWRVRARGAWIGRQTQSAIEGSPFPNHRQSRDGGDGIGRPGLARAQSVPHAPSPDIGHLVRSLASPKSPAESGVTGNADQAEATQFLAGSAGLDLSRSGPPTANLSALSASRRELVRGQVASLVANRQHAEAAAQYARLLPEDDLRQALADMKSMWKAVKGMLPDADTEVRLLTLRGHLKVDLPAQIGQLSQLFVAYAYFIENQHGKSLHEIEKIEPKITVPRLRDQLGLLKASNFIKQGKSKEATVELRAVRDDGHDAEQRARAGFLLGWIHLLDGERERARVCLADTQQRWPTTPFGQRAAKLLEDMDR